MEIDCRSGALLPVTYRTIRISQVILIYVEWTVAGIEPFDCKAIILLTT